MDCYTRKGKRIFFYPHENPGGVLLLLMALGLQ
jgi:hypothetical protein